MTTALLLDVDDTLIDTRAAMVAAGAAAVAELWPEVGAEVYHAAGVHFHSDPSGFFGRFTTGELGFAQMREARVADLLEVFSFTAIDEVNRRFEGAYAPGLLRERATLRRCPALRGGCHHGRDQDGSAH